MDDLKDIYHYIADQPSHAYYVLDNPKNKTIVHPYYIFKGTLSGNFHLTIDISKNAPSTDLDFIFSKISVGKK